MCIFTSRFVAAGGVGGVQVAAFLQAGHVAGAVKVPAAVHGKSIELVVLKTLVVEAQLY